MDHSGFLEWSFFGDSDILAFLFFHILEVIVLDDLFSAEDAMLAKYRFALVLDGRGRIRRSISSPLRFERELGSPRREVCTGKKELIAVWEESSRGLTLVAMIGMKREYPYREYPTFPGNRLIGSRLREVWPVLNERIVSLASERMRRWKREPRRLPMYFPRWKNGILVWTRETPRRRGIAFSVSLRDRMLLAQILLQRLVTYGDDAERLIDRRINHRLWSFSNEIRDATKNAELFQPTDFGSARDIREWYEQGWLSDYLLAWIVSGGTVNRKYHSVIRAILETSETGSAERFDFFVELFDEFREYRGEILPFVGADIYPQPFRKKNQEHLSFEVVPFENCFG